MHTLVCGRTRKNIKLIEAATGTAIYFPPPFPRIFGYTPPGAHRRAEDEVYITGDTPEQIARAKQKLRELVMGVKIYVKDVIVNSNKIDNILLDRLDKVRKVMEMNGSYVLFPQLGSQRGLVRIQGSEVLHVERTVREIMALVCLKMFFFFSNGLGSILIVFFFFFFKNIGWSVLQCILVDHHAGSRPGWLPGPLSRRRSYHAVRYLHQFRGRG